MSILGILLLCYTFWPLTIGIFLALLLLGTSLTFYLGIKVAPYVIAYLFLFIQTFRSSVLEPATMAISSNIRKSFPIHFPSLPTKAIYCWHPHGLYAISPFIHSCSSLTDWNSVSAAAAAASPPSLVLATHSFLSSIPFINLFPIKNKIIPVNEDVMKDALVKGSSVCLVPGGVKESFHVCEKSLKLVLKTRKGMFRIAIDTGVPLVPVLVFGENELFLPIESSIHTHFQQLLQSVTSIQFPLPRMSCLRRWFTLLRKPFEEPIETYMGEAVYPKEGDTVETLRERYVVALDALYEKHRPTGWAEKIEYQ